MGMGIAVTFVLTMASAAAYMAYDFILVPLNATFLHVIVFILLIAVLVQFVEMFLKKSMPSLYNSLGVYLPLITTNCAILGAVLLNLQEDFTFASSVVHGIGAGVGYTIAIVMFAGIRVRMERNNIPKVFQGFPIALISAGLMSMAFLGFTGLI